MTDVQAQEGGNASLSNMFEQLQSTIEAKRCDNLFQQLESRTLTADEEAVIQQRVAFQRKMFEEYEKRELKRKVEELLEVCPELTSEEASTALDLCNGNEDDAAAQLTSDPTFLRHVRATVLGTHAPAERLPRSNSSAPMGPRAKRVDLSKLKDGVFVGAFRGKGYEHQRKTHGGEDPAYVPGGGSGGSGVVAAVAAAEAEADAIPVDQVDDGASARARRASRRASSPVGAKGGVEHDAVVDVVVDAKDAGEDDSKDVGEEDTNGNNAASPVAAAATTRPQRSRASPDAPDRTAATILAQRTPKALASLSALDEPQREDVLRHAMDLDPDRGAQLVAALYDALQQGAAANTANTTAAIEQDDDAAEEEDSDFEVMPTKRSSRRRTSTSAGALSAGQQGAPRQPRSSMGAKVDGTVTGQRGKGKENTPATDGMGVAGSEGVPGVGSGGSPAAGGLRRSSRTATASPSVGKWGVQGVGAEEQGKRKAPDTGAMPPSTEKRAKPTAPPAPPSNNKHVSAISRTGHTNRGRVRQKSSKSAELVDIGHLVPREGWFNSGYIFPAGFMSRIIFRSSVHLDQLCVHECSIVGQGGRYWPKPTFQVVAMDRPDEPLVASSCTGCWTAILKRINAEIDARRKAGEDLPPPPKTAIAGPEYFGLNQQEAIDSIEALDPDHRCAAYWVGKQQREAAAAGLLPAVQPREPMKKRSTAGGSGAARAAGPKRARGRRASSESDEDVNDPDAEEAFAVGRNNWSAVSRADRYRKRRAADGEDTSLPDDDNPLYDHIDPITLEPVVCPAISPYGHVMGMATWKAVLEESEQCPFTKQPLRVVQLKKLTKANIDAYRDVIVK